MKKIIKALYPNGNVVDDWSSIKEAADYTGFNISNIRKSIKSGKLYHGFYWKNEEVQEVIKQKKVKKVPDLKNQGLFIICVCLVLTFSFHTFLNR